MHEQWDGNALLATSSRNIRCAMIVALLTQISIVDAAESNVCKVSANPSSFDHQQLILEGIVAGLNKGTSRNGRKYMTFVLRSPARCGFPSMLDPAFCEQRMSWFANLKRDEVRRASGWLTS